MRMNEKIPMTAALYIIMWCFALLAGFGLANMSDVITLITAAVIAIICLVVTPWCAFTIWYGVE